MKGPCGRGGPAPGGLSAEIAAPSRAGAIGTASTGQSPINDTDELDETFTAAGVASFERSAQCATPASRSLDPPGSAQWCARRTECRTSAHDQAQTSVEA